MNTITCASQSTATKLIHCLDTYKNTTKFFPTFQVFPIFLHHDSKTVWTNIFGEKVRKTTRQDKLTTQKGMKRTRKKIFAMMY